MKLIKVFFIIFLHLSIVFSFYGAKYEPPDNTIYHGVGWHKQSQINYMGIFPADKQPLLLQHMIAMPGTRGMTVQGILGAFAQNHFLADSQYIEMGMQWADGSGALDSVFAHTSTMDHYMDTVAAGLKTHGRPVFLRPGFEFNGAWNGFSPWTYPIAFRKLIEGLRARDVDNIATVWCYEPDGPADFADSTAQGWKWYPGDDVVDWFGLDPFPVSHFDQTLPDTLGTITKKGKTELFLKFARNRHKPVYLGETTAHSAHLVPDAQDPDSSEGMIDWDGWFEPWFTFLDSHPEIKAFNYINLDWTPFSQWSHWGDARIEINSYIKNHWVNTLSGSKFLHAGYDIDNQSDILGRPELMETDPMMIFNGPSPCNPFMTFNINTGINPGTYELQIFDIKGRLIKELKGQSRNLISWNVSGHAAGVYMINLKAGERSISRRISLIK